MLGAKARSSAELGHAGAASKYSAGEHRVSASRNTFMMNIMCQQAETLSE
jgi:hypothetical protein